MSNHQPYSRPPPTDPWGVSGGGIAGARDLVTGEAVALELRLARLPSRALALFVDLVLLAVPLIAIGLLASVVTQNADQSLSTALILVSIVAVVLGYPILFETLSRGRSPGKALLGLRVVRDDGGPVRFRHAFVRALVGVFVDFNPLAVGAVAVIVSLCSSKGKRLGDLLAGTVVVRERVPRTQHLTPPMPPHLAGWAAGLQVGLLPDPLAMEIRQLLGRLRELDPAIGGQLAARLANEVSAALGQVPPPGMDPVTFLGTVLAERRNRELARSVPPQPGGWRPQPQPPAPPPAQVPPAQVPPAQAPPAQAPPAPPAHPPPPPGPFTAPG
jgi:uncharacterized RDD family membrane protein YckC